jgi:hypothetical protein
MVDSRQSTTLSKRKHGVCVLFSFKNHLTNLLGKLGARDRAQAALIARNLGII